MYRRARRLPAHLALGGVTLCTSLRWVLLQVQDPATMSLVSFQPCMVSHVRGSTFGVTCFGVWFGARKSGLSARTSKNPKQPRCFTCRHGSQLPVPCRSPPEMWRTPRPTTPDWAGVSAWRDIVEAACAACLSPTAGIVFCASCGRAGETSCLSPVFVACCGSWREHVVLFGTLVQPTRTLW